MDLNFHKFQKILIGSFFMYLKLLSSNNIKKKETIKTKIFIVNIKIMLFSQSLSILRVLLNKQN